ncbi:NAD-dependent protein deacylase [Meridianimarinicoccus roseus]|uniref:NAD-dependent protein deacylase n=1 Tax=Meridianimarinicoccus roseus TaxID=2072018 RepID=A0A2V2L8A8_9RHOB|nr:NAD-dependent deacylase [Meridianimarinicoccus roseus]PWR01542.1 NAD-dependent protein deacylase [Meridianimarinicoccus roseus]
MTRIVVLSGAGLSAESGLGTFRDAGGLWARYPLEDVATPQGFARDPALVHDFYNARRENCIAAAPNAAHAALARLAHVLGPELLLVTQNIDDLLERAGAPEVVHMHGEVMRALCGACEHRWDAPRAMHPGDPCPACGAAATRPDVVWFGEYPYHLDRIAAALAECALFVSIGTSGSVYPAAGFFAEAAGHGARTLELNLDPSENSGRFDEARLGPAARIVPDWVDEVLAAG